MLIEIISGLISGDLDYFWSKELPLEHDEEIEVINIEQFMYHDIEYGLVQWRNKRTGVKNMYVNEMLSIVTNGNILIQNKVNETLPPKDKSLGGLFRN